MPERALSTRPSTNLVPNGVRVDRLTMHPDDRGVFTEVYRREWDTGIDPVQWNMVRSQAGVLRGVHVHPRHADYLMIVSGRASIGLRDLRRGSSTEGLSAQFTVDGDHLTALTIPPGVAHGFLFLEPSIHVYAVSRYWDVADELACHWADPVLEFDWPLTPTLLSDRDRDAGSLSDLLDELEPYQPIG
jgi:dTDP-4-dehydrorhamnose 3,5-epimerase